MDKIRVGVIGVGNIAQSAIMPAYAKQPDVEFVAVCDLKESRAREVAEKYNIPHYYTDFNEMVKRDDIDAISVCTWNNAHAPATIAALKAGKHVLCEKPPAMTVAEAEAMRDAAKESGKILMYGLVQRFRSETSVIKDFQAAGKFGDIYFGKATLLRRRGTPLGWFTDPAKAGGGPVIDIGVHVIDLTRYLMGSPKPVRVSAGVFSKHGDYKTKLVSRWMAFDTDDLVFGVEDMAGGAIHFDNGATMIFEVSWAVNMREKHFNAEIIGSKAGASIDPFTIYSEDEGYLVDISPVINKEKPFEKEVRHFLDCIKTGAEPITNADEGVEIQKILNGIYESARLGREVEL